MNCVPVTTLEEAQKALPASIMPVQGLRRDENGELSADALQTIVDGLKSRGVDMTDKATKEKIIGQLSTVLCTVNSQYQFLLNEISRLMIKNDPVPKSIVGSAQERNHFMSDILTISRHFYSIEPFDGSTTFIEGWQNTPAGETQGLFPGIEAFQATLRKQREAFQSGNKEELRKHMVVLTQEKNKKASNYLGLYGFLNLCAIGLCIYAAGLMGGEP
jgi:hypothetical protein